MGPVPTIRTRSGRAAVSVSRRGCSCKLLQRIDSRHTGMFDHSESSYVSGRSDGTVKCPGLTLRCRHRSHCGENVSFARASAERGTSTHGPLQDGGVRGSLGSRKLVRHAGQETDERRRIRARRVRWEMEHLLIERRSARAPCPVIRARGRFGIPWTHPAAPVAPSLYLSRAEEEINLSPSLEGLTCPVHSFSSRFPLSFCSSLLSRSTKPNNGVRKRGTRNPRGAEPSGIREPFKRLYGRLLVHAVHFVRL